MPIAWGEGSVEETLENAREDGAERVARVVGVARLVGGKPVEVHRAEEQADDLRVERVGDDDEDVGGGGDHQRVPREGWTVVRAAGVVAGARERGVTKLGHGDVELLLELRATTKARERVEGRAQTHQTDREVLTGKDDGAGQRHPAGVVGGHRASSSAERCEPGFRRRKTQHSRRQVVQLSCRHRASFDRPLASGISNFLSDPPRGSSRLARPPSRPLLARPRAPPCSSRGRGTTRVDNGTVGGAARGAFDAGPAS